MELTGIFPFEDGSSVVGVKHVGGEGALDARLVFLLLLLLFAFLLVLLLFLLVLLQFLLLRLALHLFLLLGLVFGTGGLGS